MNPELDFHTQVDDLAGYEKIADNQEITEGEHQGRTYSVYTKTIHHEESLWKLGRGVLAFTATFFSFGLALISPKVYNWWKEAITGNEVHTIKCLDPKELPQSNITELGKKILVPTLEIKAIQSSDLNPTKVLKIGKKLVSGASRLPVWSATLNGKEVIIKAVYKDEFKFHQKLAENDKKGYVTGFIDAMPFKDLLKLDESIIIEKRQESNIANWTAVVMEKLALSNFYDEEKGAGFEHSLPLTEKNLRLSEEEVNALKNSPEIEDLDEDSMEVIYRDVLLKQGTKLNGELINTMIECVENINYMHSQGITHGDIKLGNLGFAENHRAKFFDFGESTDKLNENTGHHKLNPKKNDTIALGKLFINLMDGKQLVSVGRHYTKGHSEPAEVFSERLFERLDIKDKEMENLIKQMLDIKNEYEEISLDSVIRKLKELQKQY